MLSEVVQFPEDEVIRYDPSAGPSELVQSLPHYDRVVKGTGLPGCEKHLEWRRELYRSCKASKSMRETVRQWFREDMLFFMNAALWLYEPREEPTIRPFNTWAHQDEAIAHIEKYMGKRTIGIEKSRGEGASWLVLMTYLHQWLFFDLRTFGIVSKDEKTANDYTNPDSLTFKFIWQLDRIGKCMPWLLPKGWDQKKHFSSTKGSIVNPENNSTINAYSATGCAGTGGRKTSVMMDELSKFPRGDDYDVMASMQPVTNCRILVSTPFGDSGAYYDAMHTKGSQMLKIVLHWPMNPTRNRGLYQWMENEEKPRLLDEGYVYQEGYKFVQDGKLRSPWYDRQAAEPDMIADPRKMAQEYDLNYGGSTVKFYDAGLRNRIEALVRNPWVRGEVDYDEFGSVGKWEEIHGGKTKLWMPVGAGKPASGRYVVGVDISAGVGGTSSSNSAIVALDEKTGEQVLEWVDSMTRPTECAQQAVAICKWLALEGDYPLLVWESNGQTGAYFTEEVKKLGYPHLYRQYSRTKVRNERTKMLGYRTVNRNEVHEKIRGFLSTGRVSIRSQHLFDELNQFEYTGDKVSHNGNLLKEDGATGKAHGDIVVALGMACMGLESTGGGAQLEPDKSPVETTKFPAQSMGARIQALAKRERNSKRDLVNW